MPTSCAHKFQAIRDRWSPELELEVYHVALTLEQVMEFDLPSTPLKGKDGRARLWKEQMRHEQTEIDALAALRPADLRRIAMDAIKPFFDPMLARRGRQVRDEWLEEAEDKLKAHPQYESWSDRIEEARSAAESAAGKLDEVQEQAAEELEQDLPQLELPEAEIDVEAPNPLFTTDDDFSDATPKLMQRKKYNL